MASNAMYGGGMPRVSFETLGNLGAIYEAAQLKAKREQIAAGVSAGSIDPRSAFAQLIGLGDTQAASALSTATENEANRAFREREAARAQGNADRTYGLSVRQLEDKPQIKSVKDDTGAETLWQVYPDGRSRRIDTSITPTVPPSRVQPAGPEPVPQPPLGVDIPTYRKESAKGAVKEINERSELRRGGDQVLGLVDQFETKIINPTTGQYSKQFGSAVGPFVGAASDAHIATPWRLGYEAFQSSENKAFLDRVKSDAQAINTVMQRALLKGGGAITENERLQINEILGKISTARSPQDAKALLDNYRGIVRKLFLMDDPGAARPTPTAPRGMPPPPPGFVVQ